MNDTQPAVGGSLLIKAEYKDDESISTTIFELVATVSERPIEDLPLLYDTVDPDRLDELADGLTTGYLSFRYAGYRIVVDDSGTVAVFDPE